jgi:hypothetical protein
MCSCKGDPEKSKKKLPTQSERIWISSEPYWRIWEREMN